MKKKVTAGHASTVSRRFLSTVLTRRTAAGHVALALLPSQRALPWKRQCVRGLNGETWRNWRGKKMQAMKTGDFLGQIGFMMLNQSSGFESCVRLEPWNPGILGLAVGDAPRCFP